jgi:trehalose 6-phosphate synthase/phosphatase
MLSEPSANRLIVVSNRLPFILRRGADGQWQTKPGSGGLISALVPTLRNRGGVWVGWPGITDGDAGELESVLTELTQGVGYRLKPVVLSEQQQHGFYYGFSNEIIWPLFHDLQSNCNFDPEYWRTYQVVNRKYAKAVAGLAAPDDFIWVHDYHLMQLATELRQMQLKNRIGFFLHTPFPPLDIFLKLPWRFEIICGMLQFDLVGFQTLRDRRNFLQCIRALYEHARIDGDKEEQVLTIRIPRSDLYFGNDAGLGGDQEIRVGSFPIGIDYRTYAERAASKAVEKIASYLRSSLQGKKMILGVDRMDYTKGITSRLEAFALALRRYPDLIEQVTLVQHVVPSREDIPEYHDLKNEIERLVSEINGEFTRAGWVPVHYIHSNMGFDRVLAYYRAADIALVTPLKDGMNLVAKEYCAAQVDNKGVLILSEFAGAAAQLQNGALLVNPYDIEGTAESIYTAVNMPQEERISRMRELREVVRNSDIFSWADSFLHAAIDKNLSHFPVIEDYIPHGNSL